MVHKLLLSSLYFEDAILNRMFHEETVHRDRACLPEAVNAVNGLVLDAAVPPAVHEPHMVRRRQVQSDATGTERHEQK